MRLWTANECTTYTSDNGALTPAAVKKAFGLFNAVSSTTSERTKYLETWKNDKSNTYGIQSPLCAWWETESICKLTVDGYQTKVDLANKLTTARTVSINLSSTSAASFDGSADITPGITGTLLIENGGTGANSAINARYNLLYVNTPIKSPTNDTTGHECEDVAAEPLYQQAEFRAHRGIAVQLHVHLHG